MSTRHYRAPELIILEPEYDQAVDVWSLGCILVELIQLVNGQKVTKAFNGSFCQPLSPRGKADALHEDQLSCIITNRGLEIKRDLSFIKSKDAVKYVKQLALESTKESKFPAMGNVDPLL